MLEKRWMATLFAFVLLAAGWLGGVQLARAELALGSGAQYTSGTYGGAASTQILTIPLTARYEKDAWLFRASVPYLRITGPGNVIPGVGPIDALANTVG